MAAWFQVNCQHCTRALQVQAGVGVHPVQCVSCRKPFDVQIHESWLPTRAARAIRQPKEARVLPATLVAFNAFKKAEHATLKRDRQDLSVEARFRLVETLWQSSSSNPKNHGIGATADATIGAGTSGAGRAAPPAAAPPSPATDPATTHPAGEPAANSTPSPARVSKRGVGAARAAAARAAQLDPTAAARPAAAPDPPAEVALPQEDNGEDEEDDDDELSMAEVYGLVPKKKRSFGAIHAPAAARTAASRGASRARGMSQGRRAETVRGRGRGRGLASRGRGRGRGGGRGRGRGDGAARNTRNTEEDESWVYFHKMDAAKKAREAQHAKNVARNEVVEEEVMTRGWGVRVIPGLEALAKRRRN